MQHKSDGGSTHPHTICLRQDRNTERRSGETAAIYRSHTRDTKPTNSQRVQLRKSSFRAQWTYTQIQQATSHTQKRVRVNQRILYSVFFECVFIFAPGDNISLNVTTHRRRHHHHHHCDRVCVWVWTCTVYLVFDVLNNGNFLHKYEHFEWNLCLFYRILRSMLNDHKAYNNMLPMFSCK